MLDLFKRKLFKIIFWSFVFIALPFTILMFIGSQRYVYHATVKINSPAEIIFPYLHTPDKVVVWQNGVKSLSLGNNQFNRSGDTATLVLDGQEKEHRITITIDKIVPDRYLITSSATEVFKAQTIWDLETFADHCIVNQEVIYFYGGVGRLIAPFLTGEAERQLQDDLSRLRQIIEKEHTGR